MYIAGLETKDAARQVEGPNLPAAIGENLVGAHRARYDLVDVVCLFVLAKDLRVVAVGHYSAHQVDRVTERAIGYFCPDWRIVYGSADETTAACVLRQHGLTSRQI